MKNMFSLILFIACIILPACSMAQDPLVIGQSYTIQSKALLEDRHIQIYLPITYNDPKYPNQQYPVIYLLDGETNFNYMAAYMDKLSKYPYPAIPEMIVVGIKNTNRTRDLTPSKVVLDSVPSNRTSKISGETGGNLNFFKFIREELFTYVNKNYRTLDYKLLIGHSFGGITALNNLISHTDMFNAYIVHDPSIWWDNQVILKEYDEHLRSKDFKNRRLFLSQAGEGKNMDHLSVHYKTIKAFDNLITKNTPNTLAYKYVQYNDEDHGSIVLKGNIDGLRFVFEGYKINFKEIETNPSLIKDTYAKISQMMHYEIKPTEKYLDTIIAFFDKTNKNAVANKVREYKDTLYTQVQLQ